MSFDVYLMSFRNGVDGPVDSTAARAVLAQHKYRHDPESSFYLVEFPDGSSLEMCSGGPDAEADSFGGGLIKLHGLSEPICDFMFQLSRAAGCVILPVMEPPYVLIPRPGLGGEHLPPEVINGWEQIAVASGAEIFHLISGGYAAWRAFCNRVVRHPGQVSEQ